MGVVDLREVTAVLRPTSVKKEKRNHNNVLVFTQLMTLIVLFRMNEDKKHKQK